MASFELPTNVRSRNAADTVSYYVSEGEKEKTLVKNICYANHMKQLTTCEFWLVPDQYSKINDAVVAPDVYLQWIELLKSYQVIPYEVVASHDETGLKMHIPKTGKSKHSIYAALCAYRWAESRAPIPYTVVKLTEQKPDLSFWQILHYALSQYCTAVGHNWCYLTRSSYFYGNYGQSFNLAIALAVPFFWRGAEEDRVKRTGYTTDAINEVANVIGPTIAEKGVPLPTLLIDGRVESDKVNNDILNPVWTPMYKYADCVSQAAHEKQKVKDDLLTMYNEIKKDNPTIDACIKSCGYNPYRY